MLFSDHSDHSYLEFLSARTVPRPPLGWLVVGEGLRWCLAVRDFTFLLHLYFCVKISSEHDVTRVQRARAHYLSFFGRFKEAVLVVLTFGTVVGFRIGGCIQTEPISEPILER